MARKAVGAAAASHEQKLVWLRRAWALNAVLSKARLLEDHPERNDEIVRLVRSGHSYGDVAYLLNVSRNTVAGAVFRAKRRERAA